MKKRLIYTAAFVLLTAVEVLIALFVNDRFVRPYLGDIIVVWVVFCFAQIFLCHKVSPYITAVGVFLFACLVEILQGIKIVELLGLGHIPFFRTLIGTQFDLKDIICYGAGTAILCIAIFLGKKIFDRTEKSHTA